MKKKKKRPREEDVGGLKPGASGSQHDPDEECVLLPSYYTAFDGIDGISEEEDKDAKARRVVRANNFTQQTNVCDVDKHMYAAADLG